MQVIDNIPLLLGGNLTQTIKSEDKINIDAVQQKIKPNEMLYKPTQEIDLRKEKK